ncbi:hypothetical protein VMT65_19080 [Nocardia sp. CDC153]|uniref:hypothetical protein n=1 Tax=Nocardia sp. CDC153 TaxID=3112167 RepID=UPI002DBBF20F|nr:hypothetical protein [Nocardia sp. CDC153]MEC3955154.1 hypothetical protein [Nocardia sp. CDC153]
MSDLKSIAALQRRVYEFLERQDESTLRAIIDGSARLEVVGAAPRPETAHTASSPTPSRSDIEPSRDPAQVASSLSPMPPDQRRSYLSTSPLSVPQLREVAKQLGLRGYSKFAKARLVDFLVTGGSSGFVASAADNIPDGNPRAAAAASTDSPRPDVEAERIASQLRATETEEEGFAYLRAQGLDHQALLAVAHELHLTRVERLSRTELERRVLKQAIGARRKFAGLRKW